MDRAYGHSARLATLPDVHGRAIAGWILSAAAIVAAPAPAAAAGVTVTSAVQYATAEVGAPRPGRAPLLLDLYEPPGQATRARPVVVLIHGGGFVQQSRTDAGIVRMARGLAARGIVAASIDYRLVGQAPVPSRRVAPIAAALPQRAFFSGVAAAIDDTLTAIDYLHANARRLNVDPRRLGLVGSSAGAITADHVAYALDDHGVARPTIRFVGSLWGGMLLPPPTGRSDARPPLQLDRGEAALFAVHGAADRRLPVGLSDDLVARARQQGVRTVYDRMPGADHGYAPSGFFTATVAGGQTPFERLLAFAAQALRG